MNQLETEAAKEREEERKEKEAEQERFFKEVKRIVQSLEDRQNNVFHKLAKITEDQEIRANLIAALRSEQSGKNLFKETRQKLIEAIILGQDEKQLRKPEVMPWVLKSQYKEPMDYLRNDAVKSRLKAEADTGNPHPQSLLGKIETIFKNNSALKNFISKQSEIINKAFQTRENNDKKRRNKTTY